jgi:hypothetical protein
VKPCGQTDLIPAEHRLWRRVQDDPDHLWWDAAKNRWRPVAEPPSNAVQIDPDGVSMVWAEHAIEVHDADPSSALIGAPSSLYRLVYELAVAVVRGFPATVVHSPVGDRHPGCAHASAAPGPPAEGQRKKDARREFRLAMSMSMELAHGEPTVKVPPGA